jgi:hypothetical protein
MHDLVDAGVESYFLKRGADREFAYADDILGQHKLPFTF